MTILNSMGFPPKLSDDEVLTVELIGEFFEIDTDQWIWQYFRCHWSEWFPNVLWGTLILHAAQCASPHVPVASRCGTVINLHVRYHCCRKHLPIVELRPAM